jgi:putative ABC transport system permease protein
MDSAPRFRFSRLVERNLANRPYRNIATVFVFAIVAATLFSSQYLTSGAEKSLNAGISRMGADIMVVPEGYTHEGETILLTGRPTSFFFEDAGYEEISRIPGVAKASPQIYIATLFASCCAAPVQMIAIDPERDFTISPWLAENPGVTLRKDDIIIGSAIIQNVGKDLMFYGHTFHVVGILGQTGTGVDNSVFTRFEDAYVMADESGEKAVKKLTIPRGMVSAVLVKVKPGASPKEVAAGIRKTVPGTKTILPDGLLSAVSGQLGAVTQLLEGSAIAVVILSIPLLGTVSAMVAHERRKELAILRALGATKGFTILLMLTEAFTLAVIGGLVGVGVASGLLFLYQDYIRFSLEIPFIVPAPLALLSGAGVALLLTVGIAGISSLYPVLLVTRADPWEGIRGGEP